jgi:hypothetical protein
MPTVGGKRFAYTKAGYKAARKAGYKAPRTKIKMGKRVGKKPRRTA